MRIRYWIYRVQERLYCTEREALLFVGGLAFAAISVFMRATAVDAELLVDWSYREMDSLFVVLSARADSVEREEFWQPSDQVAARDTIDFPIHLNQAETHHLQALPGIGPAIAARILAERSRNGPFKTVDDLLRVRGIGPKTLEKLRELVTVDPPPDQTEQLR